MERDVYFSSYHDCLERTDRAWIYRHIDRRIGGGWKDGELGERHADRGEFGEARDSRTLRARVL